MPISLQLKRLKVRSLDLGLLEISWQVDDPLEDVYEYTFQVYRSESPSGPWDALCVPFQDRYLFIDNAINVGDRWRTLHYLVRVSQVSSGDSLDVGPVTMEAEPDLITLELRRHMQLLFHEFAGRKTWVLPLRTFGQRCSCWSTTLQKRTRSRCLTCFDTGFVRGYMSPIEVWMSIDPSAKTTQTTNVGAMQQSNTTARVGYYPPLKPGDVLVEPENRRWRLNSVSQTEHVRAGILQVLSMHEIPQKDIEFAIPLRLAEALEDAWFSPPRNFTAPTNLQNVADTDVLDPLAIYGSVIPNPGSFGNDGDI